MKIKPDNKMKWNLRIKTKLMKASKNWNKIKKEKKVINVGWLESEWMNPECEFRKGSEWTAMTRWHGEKIESWNVSAGQNQTHNKHSLHTFSSTRYWLIRSESRLMSAIVMASPITLGTRPLNIKLWDITHCERKSMESIEGPWKI